MSPPSGSSEPFDFDAFWDLEHPSDTEKRFQEILSQLEDSAQVDASYRIELLTQLARAQGLQNRFDEAKVNLDRASILINDPDKTHRLVSKIRHFLELGRIPILQRIPSQARPPVVEAWTLASNAGLDYYSIDAAQMLASIEPQKVKKDWILKALSLAEGSNQPQSKEWLGSLYASLAWLYYDVRQFTTALENFQKTLSEVTQQGKARKIITAKWAVAKTLRALNRLEEAFDMQQVLLAQLNQLNVKDGYVYEELAECLQSLKRGPEAQVYFDLAYHELKTDLWLTDNHPARIKRLKEMGKSKDHVERAKPV